MPRLRTTPEDKADQAFRTALNRQRAVLELNDTEIAGMIGRERTIICRLRKKPGTCTLDDFRALAKRLHWT